MSSTSFSFTTVDSAELVLLTPPPNQQFEIKFLSGFKASTFTITLSIKSPATGEQGSVVRIITTQTLTGGGTFLINDPITIDGGEKLVAQCDLAGVDINGSYDINPFIG